MACIKCSLKTIEKLKQVQEREKSEMSMSSDPF